MAEPKLEWYIDKAGKFRFRVVAANGETIFVSPRAYKSRKECIEAMAQRAFIESRLDKARCLMTTLEAEEFLLTVGQPIGLGGEIIAQKSRDGTIVLYEVVE